MKRSLLAAILFILFSAGLPAQSTATLTGTVTDPSGAVVAGASVVCTNTETHLVLRAETNGSGLFRIANVPVGAYEISVSHAGFAGLVRSGIDLLTEHTVDLNLVLRIGETNQSIAVNAPAPLVQSASSDVQTTIDSRQMSELPLNGRNAFQLATLVPGAVATEADTVVGQQDNVGLSVNGARPVDNNWQLDGGTYTNRNFGSAPTLPNPDTLQEFTALTSNFSAENRSGGAVIKLTTRSGTNQFHGTLFEFLRNDALDTRNFFSLNTEKYKQNQYGGTVGGPLRKNRLFFFGSYQGTIKRGNPSPISSTVPSVQQHAGNFTDSGHAIVDPKSGLPFPDNIIPKDRWDSAGTKMLSVMPLPNLGTNTLVAPPPSQKGDDQFSVKADYVLNERNHLSGRYFWDRNTFQRDVTSLPGFYGQDYFRNQTMLVSAAHTFSPTWVMENTFNYLRTFRTEEPVGQISTADLGVKAPLAQANVPFPQILVTLTGYTRLYSSRSVIFNPAVAEYQNSTSHPAGKHFIRFGGSLRYNHESAINVGDPYGAFTFSNTRTLTAAVRNSGDAIGSLLLGLPTTFSQSANPPAQLFVSTLFDLWIQDDWKVSRRLTLNLGLRYDPWLPARDDAGALPGFIPGAHSKIMPLAPAGIVVSGDPGIPAGVLRSRWQRPGPRIGFAWDVAGNGKNIVRGGYGVFYKGSEWFGMMRGFANTSPFRAASISLNSPPSTVDPYAGYGSPVPFPFVPPTKDQLATFRYPANSALNAFDPTMRPGYLQSWNLTVERQILKDTAMSVAYVGNHFLGGLGYLSVNSAVYGPGATAANEAARMPYQGLAAITLGSAFNHGTYNALQVQVTKRPTRGLTLLANYTFSKALDINSTQGSVGDFPRNPYNANLDKGPADFDNTHSLKASVLYDLPKVATRSQVARAVLNNWQINSIFTARSGFAFTCRSGGDNSLSGIRVDTCDQVLADTSRPDGADPIKHWFNQAAFKQNAIGTYGQAGRGILRRPGALNMDVSLFKRIPITDRVMSELRVETFNALNHPNLDLFYNTGGYSDSQVFTSATFGQIIHAGDPRLIQVALKLRF